MEGRIETRDWVGQDGVKRYRTEIIVDNMIMLDGGGQRSAATPGMPNAMPRPANDDDGSVPVIQVSEEEIKVEDIPF
jgi:single-strand DNA-binding protein